MIRKGKKTLATELRHYISIYQITSATDGEGGFGESLTLVKQCFAAIYPIRAIQRAEYKSINVDATHLIKVRGYIDVNELYTIKYDSRAFEVLTVENIQERDFEQVITCRERRE